MFPFPKRNFALLQHNNQRTNLGPGYSLIHMKWLELDCAAGEFGCILVFHLAVVS